MTPNLHLLAPAGEVLISAYVGSGAYIFDAPPLANSLGSGMPRRFRFCFSVTKATAIDSGNYLRLETSPDGGTTWFAVQASYDDSAAANFLAGKTGVTSAAFEIPVEFFAGQKVRLRASAGLTLGLVGIVY